MTEPAHDPFSGLMATAEITPEDPMWLRYNFSTGAARTGLLTAGGLAVVLRDFPLDPFWWHLARLGPGRVAFHNGQSGLVTIGEVSAEGTFADVRNNPGAELSHQLVGLFDDLLLFYTVRSGPNGYLGEAVVGRVAADGGYARISEPYLWDFWTHIVPVQDGLVFFYNAQTRLAATGRFTGDGGFADLATHPGFDPWTHILVAADGTLFFYHTTTGAAASGRVGPDGGFTNLFAATFGPAWGFVPVPDGRMLVQRSGDTLVAQFGGASGWFSDARVVDGLILPLPTLFVR